jgi:hypothetical protein
MLSRFWKFAKSKIFVHLYDGRSIHEVEVVF